MIYWLINTYYTIHAFKLDVTGLHLDVFQPGIIYQASKKKDFTVELIWFTKARSNNEEPGVHMKRNLKYTE